MPWRRTSSKRRTALMRSWPFSQALVRAESVTMLGLMPWRSTSYKRRKASVRSVPFSHVLVKAE